MGNQPEGDTGDIQNRPQHILCDPQHKDDALCIGISIENEYSRDKILPNKVYLAIFVLLHS